MTPCAFEPVTPECTSSIIQEISAAWILLRENHALVHALVHQKSYTEAHIEFQAAVSAMQGRVITWLQARNKKRDALVALLYKLEEAPETVTVDHWTQVAGNTNLEPLFPQFKQETWPVGVPWLNLVALQLHFEEKEKKEKKEKEQAEAEAEIELKYQKLISLYNQARQDPYSVNAEEWTEAAEAVESDGAFGKGDAPSWSEILVCLRQVWDHEKGEGQKESDAGKSAGN